MSRTNRPLFLQYDIPENRVVLASGRIESRPVHQNPSDDLWRAGAVRITYSCWLVMESDLPRVYLVTAPMIESGCRVYTVPFDVSATEELKSMALANIQREIADHLERARRTRAEAEERFDDESDHNYAVRRRRFLSAAATIERRVTQMVSCVSAAALRFGITPDQLRRSEAVGAVELIASNMRDRAQTFARTHGILTRGGSDTAIRRAMTDPDSPMPPEIVADYLEETDQIDAGQQLRDAFAGS